MFSTPQHSSALSGTNITDNVGETPGVVGNRSQDVILPTSQPELNASGKPKKAWRAAWKGLETALRLLEKSADACPPLKSAVGGLVASLDLTQVGYDCGFDTLDLI